MSTTTDRELKYIFPESEIELAGCKFILRPFSFHETFLVGENLKGVFHLIKDNMPFEELANVLLSCGKGIETVLTMALNLPEEEIQKFDVKTAIKAIVEIVKVNADFFALIQEDLRALRLLKTATGRPSRLVKQS